MHNLREIKVWRKQIELSTVVYQAVSNFPYEEKYGLSSQIKRSVVSIASNIANGSSYELLTQIMIAKNLNLVDSIQTAYLIAQIEEVQKMIYGFTKKLKKD